MSSSEGRVLVDEYPTELSLPAKQLCPEARIEDSTPKTKNFLPPASHLSSVAYCLFQPDPPEADPPCIVAGADPLRQRPVADGGAYRLLPVL